MEHYGQQGNTEDKAKASLVDAEVIRYFKEVDTLPAGRQIGTAPGDCRIYS